MGETVGPGRGGCGAEEGKQGEQAERGRQGGTPATLTSGSALPLAASPHAASAPPVAATSPAPGSVHRVGGQLPASCPETRSPRQQPGSL